jgi:hypothetical protein
LSQEENADDDRRDCQRSADAEIAPEVDLDAFGRGAEGSSKLDLRDEDAGGLRFDLAEIHLVAQGVSIRYSAEMKG